jgi:hypothetical protein
MSGASHVASEGFSDGLVSETDSEDRNFPGEVADQSDADACLMRRARAGRDDDFFRLHGFDFGDRYLIVPANLYFRA